MDLKYFTSSVEDPGEMKRLHCLIFHKKILERYYILFAIAASNYTIWVIKMFKNVLHWGGGR